MITEARKRELDKLRESRGLVSDITKNNGVSGITPQRKAELDALRAKRNEEGFFKGLAKQSESGVLPAEIAKGAGKGALSTISGAASLGEKAMGSFWKTVLPKGAERAMGLENAPTLGIFGEKSEAPTSAKVLQSQAEKKLGYKEGTLTTAEGAGQKLGFGAEQMGEFFIPGTASLKAGKGAAAMVKGAGTLAKIARPAAKIVGMGAAEGLLSGGQRALQTGKIGGEELAFGVGGAIGAPLLGLGLPPVAKFLGKKTGLNKLFLPPTSKKAQEIAIEEADALIRRATDTSAQAGKRKILQKTGDELSTIIREEQIPLGRQAGTQSVVVDATVAEPVIKLRTQLIDDTIDKILETNKTRQFNLREIKRDAFKKIDDFIKDSTDNAAAKAKVEERINNVLADPRYGEKIYDTSGNIIDASFTGKELRELRSGWGKAKATKWNDPTDYGALNQMYFAANDAIQNGYRGSAIPALNKQFTRLIALSEALNPAKAGSLHGKVISGGGLGKIITQVASRAVGGVVGAAAGSPAGFVGSAMGLAGGQEIGARIAGRLVNRNLNPERLTSKALELLKKAGVKSKTEQVVEDALKKVVVRPPVKIAGLLTEGAIPLPAMSESARLAAIRESGIVRPPIAPSASDIVASKKAAGIYKPPVKSKGIKKFLDDWTWKKHANLTPEIENELSRYKPKGEVTLYRAQKVGKETPLQSWTYQKGLAQSIVESRPGYTLRTSKVHPDDILVDFTKLPNSQDYLNEVIVKSKQAQPPDFNATFNVGKADITDDTIKNYLKVVKENERPFLNTTKDIADSVNGNFIYRTKSPESIKIKMARRSENFKLNNMADTLASSVIVEEKNIQKAIDYAKKNYDIVNIDDFRKNKTFWGYNGIHLDYKMPNGQITEIQIHTPQSLAAKQFTHPMYERWRPWIEENKNATIDIIEAKLPKNLRQTFRQNVELSNRAFEGKIKLPQQSIARRALELTQKNGGITIKLNGDIPTKGFSTAISKETERIIPFKKAKEQDVWNYVYDNFDNLSSKKAHLGMWVDEGKLYFDVPSVFLDKAEALRTAKKASQLGIYDLDKGETINVLKRPPAK